MDINDLRDRLLNWKFSQAAEHLDKLPKGMVGEEHANVIGALCRVFGNSGWLDGDLAVIVDFVVARLTDSDPEESDG